MTHDSVAFITGVQQNVIFLLALHLGLTMSV